MAYHLPSASCMAPYHHARSRFRCSLGVADASQPSTISSAGASQPAEIQATFSPTEQVGLVCGHLVCPVIEAIMTECDGTVGHVAEWPRAISE